MEPQDYDAIRQTLEAMEHCQLVQAADLGRLLERMDRRVELAEQTMHDTRLTLTGIGALAKSLTERTQVHEDILRSLTAMLAAQQQRNAHQETLNERLTTAIERLDVTQARIETLLARMIERSANGKDA